MNHKSDYAATYMVEDITKTLWHKTHIGSFTPN
jgi:hypothetical protein